MTLITITTVGYAGSCPSKASRRACSTGLISLAGFGAVTFLFTSLAVFFLERDLDSTPGRRMEKQIPEVAASLHRLRFRTCRSQCCP